MEYKQKRLKEDEQAGMMELTALAGNRAVLQMMMGDGDGTGNGPQKQVQDAEKETEEITQEQLEHVQGLYEELYSYIETLYAMLQNADTPQEKVIELLMLIGGFFSMISEWNYMFLHNEKNEFGEIWRILEYSYFEGIQEKHEEAAVDSRIGREKVRKWGERLCMEMGEENIFAEDPPTKEEEEAIEERMDELNRGEEEEAVKLITALEEEADSHGRPQFMKELLENMPISMGEHHCHRISYEYIRSGCVTPILDCLSGVIHVMSYYETDLPEYATVDKLEKSLYGIIHAVFPLTVKGSTNTMTEAQANFSRKLFADSKEQADKIVSHYMTFLDDQLGHVIIAFNMEMAKELIQMCMALAGYLNSSPENLRPGNGATNESIHQALDIPEEDLIPQYHVAPEMCAGVLDHLDVPGVFTDRNVTMVRYNSPSHLALVFLLLYANTGDTPIDVYSGRLPSGEDGGEERNIMQTSSIPYLYAGGMREGGLDLAFDLKLIEDPPNWPEKLLMSTQEMEYFRFSRHITHTHRTRDRIPPIPVRMVTRASERAQQKARLDQEAEKARLERERIEEAEREDQARMEFEEEARSAFESNFGVSIVEGEEVPEGSNCLFGVLITQLGLHGIPITDAGDFITRLRTASNQKEGLVSLEGDQNTVDLVRELAAYIGHDVTIFVQEPYGRDDSNQIQFRSASYSSSSSNAGIVLNVYSNALHHYFSFN